MGENPKQPKKRTKSPSAAMARVLQVADCGVDAVRQVPDAPLGNLDVPLSVWPIGTEQAAVVAAVVTSFSTPGDLVAVALTGGGSRVAAAVRRAVVLCHRHDVDAVEAELAEVEGTRRALAHIHIVTEEHPKDWMTRWPWRSPRRAGTRGIVMPEPTSTFSRTPDPAARSARRGWVMPARNARAVSLWATGQKHPRYQRGDRYAATSLAHPAKMFPAIAAHAINAYSRTGDTVIDPMCGVGTTLVEAMHLGRNAIGVDCEAEWVAVAAGNLHLTRQVINRDDVTGSVLRGDATRLSAVLPFEAVGAVDLIVTSPPYGSMTHGLLDHDALTSGKVVKAMHRYSNHKRNHRAQLAHRNLQGLSHGLEEVFAACHAVLKPGGIMAVAARPWTHNGHLVDFPSIVTRAALLAGFDTRERCAALLGSWHGHHVTAHHTFFRLHNTRTARARGRPAHLIVHEDILVFGR